jgi:hypothetical protein
MKGRVTDIQEGNKKVNKIMIILVGLVDVNVSSIKNKKRKKELS